MSDQPIDTQDTGAEPTQQPVTQTGVLGTEQAVGVTGSNGEPTNVQPVDQGFIEQIPEEFRNEPCLSSIKDVSALAKGYVHAQKELGGRIRIPGPDASPEVKAEFQARMEAAGYSRMPDLNNPTEKESFFNKLGRPETPDGYDAEIPEELGAMVNPEQLKNYREVAHKAGLSKDQAKALLEFDINRTMEQMEANQQVAKTTLSSEWGDAFDQRINLAKEGLKRFEEKYPEHVNAIRQGPAGNNPVVLMMAAELGKMYKESGIVVGNRSVNYGLTPTEAKARINEVMGNTGHAYHNDSDPKHWQAVEEVETLYKAAYPESSSKS